MILAALQLALLTLLAATASVTAARAAIGRGRRAALLRQLRELGASLAREGGAEITEVASPEDGLSVIARGLRYRARLVRRPGRCDVLAIALDLDDDAHGPLGGHASGAGVEPAGYRARARDEVRGAPWIALTRRSSRAGADAGNSPRGRGGGVPGFDVTWARRTSGSDAVPRLLASPALQRALAALAEAGVDRVDVGDGAPAITATLRDPRPDQLNPFAFREIAAGLAGAAAALPVFTGRPVARRRADAADLILGLAAALALTAPLFAYPSDSPWLAPDSPAGASAAVGAAIGLGAWALAAIPLGVLGRAWPEARRRALLALAALFVALPADGAGLSDLVVDPTARASAAGWSRDLVRPTPPPERRPRPLPSPDRLARPLGMKHVGVVWQKPPLNIELFDLRLANDAPVARWFLLPDDLDEPSRPRPEGLVAPWVIEAQDLGGRGHVPVLSLFGSDFQAILLPAHADVVIGRFQIDSHFSRRPDRVKVEVIIADDLRWDGRPVESWLGASPLASAAALVADCRHDLDCPFLDARRPPDERGRPLSYTEIGRLGTEVALTLEQPR